MSEWGSWVNTEMMVSKLLMCEVPDEQKAGENVQMVVPVKRFKIVTLSKKIIYYTIPARRTGLMSRYGS